MSESIINTNDIIINKKEKLNIVIKTLCRIFVERKYTTKSLDEVISKILPSMNDDEMLFTIDNKKYGIKFINSFLTTIKKEVSIENFLTKNTDTHKFIIINKLSERAIKQIIEYQNTEVFTIDELLIVIIDHNIVPQHILLTPDEKDKYFTVFNHHPKDMKKILLNDPIARFYGAKVGDLFKIIRSNITSGKEIDYRIVIPGDIKLDE
jgi:DNA-directed RNA polymerase I, II, and III subunit RPABC1